MKRIIGLMSLLIVGCMKADGQRDLWAKLQDALGATSALDMTIVDGGSAVEELHDKICNITCDIQVIHALPYTITVSGRYALSQDVTINNGGNPLLTVAADHVYVDLCGHTIESTNANDDGVVISQVQHVTITNGVISGMRCGINMQDAQYIAIQNLEIRENIQKAIYGVDVSTVTIQNIVIDGSSAYGIAVETNQSNSDVYMRNIWLTRISIAAVIVVDYAICELDTIHCSGNTGSQIILFGGNASYGKLRYIRIYDNQEMHRGIYSQLGRTEISNALLQNNQNMYGDMAGIEINTSSYLLRHIKIQDHVSVLNCTGIAIESTQGGFIQDVIMQSLKSSPNYQIAGLLISGSHALITNSLISDLGDDAVNSSSYAYKVEPESADIHFNHCIAQSIRGADDSSGFYLGDVDSSLVSNICIQKSSVSYAHIGCYAPGNNAVYNLFISESIFNDNDQAGLNLSGASDSIILDRVVACGNGPSDDQNYVSIPVTTRGAISSPAASHDFDNIDCSLSAVDHLAESESKVCTFEAKINQAESDIDQIILSLNIA